MELSQSEKVLKDLYEVMYVNFEEFRYGSTDLRFLLLGAIEKMNLSFSDKDFMLLIRREGSVYEYDADKALIFKGKNLIKLNLENKTVDLIKDFKIEKVEILNSLKNRISPESIKVTISGDEYEFTKENRYGEIDILEIAKKFY